MDTDRSFLFLIVVSNAWLETLLSAIDALPKETIRQEVMTTALFLLPIISKPMG